MRRPTVRNAPDRNPVPCFPAQPLSLEQAAKLVHLSPERLAELTEAGYAPHFRIDSGPPLYHRASLRRWVIDNLITAVKGTPMPRECQVFTFEPSPQSLNRAPDSIAHIVGLRYLPTTKLPPAIYFLVRQGVVVYVGQSTRTASRVASHADGEKLFDSVFFLPVSRPELDRVEQAFINILKPEYNGSFKGELDLAADIQFVTEKYCEPLHARPRGGEGVGKC